MKLLIGYCLNILKSLEDGSGLNIDASRVAATSEKYLKENRSERPSKTSNSNESSLHHGGLEGLDRSDRSHVIGRFPANLVLSHNDDCIEVGTKKVKGEKPRVMHIEANEFGCTPGCAVLQVWLQSVMASTSLE